MNKKGFTLIELLAVIVILAIIALIAVPIVLSIISDSKESASLRSAEMYLKGVETSVATAILNEKNITDGTYSIMSNGNICIGTITNNTCSEEETLKVEMNGETPTSGSVTIESGKVTDITFTYTNGKIIVKNNEGKLVYGVAKEYKTYVVGDTVTIGTEMFYVIADSDKTQEIVTLLTRDCLDTTTLQQSASPTAVGFSSSNYWSSETEYPIDLNNYVVPEGVTSIITLAKSYGTKVGGTGRLLTKTEAEILLTTNRDILYGTDGKSSNTRFFYWLGTASTTTNIWAAAASGSADNWTYFLSGDSSYSMNVFYKLRPVVEISKDKIS